MKNEFSKLPQPIQRQIFIRTGFGLIFIIIFIALLFMTTDAYAIFPAAGMFVFCLGSALHLFHRGITKNYVVVKGVCEETTKTLFTRRIKAIILTTEQYTVQIAPWHRPRRIPEGAIIELYVSPNTPVYERDGVQVLQAYLAMDVKGDKK